MATLANMALALLAVGTTQVTAVPDWRGPGSWDHHHTGGPGWKHGAPPSCKAYPGQQGWPAEDAWQALNKTVGGRLIKTEILPGGVCHQGQPNYDESQCANVAQQWTNNSAFHAQNYISVMSNDFTNWTCLPDPKMPCTPEGYPAYVIKVTCPEDVKAGIDFARKTNVRLNVKSSGHDFLGRSNAPGTLSLWTYNLNSIDYHPGQYKLSSGRVIENNTVTIGSAAAMEPLYTALDKYNQTFIGGGSKTVSAGGYIAGGGHSILSPHYGMSADMVVEIEVVTPDGKIQTVNQDVNPDLFWALRGGGGSTFGVVTKYTSKTVPSPKMTMVTFVAFTTPGSPIESDLIGYVASVSPYLMNSGLSGYNIVSTNFSNPAPGSGLPAQMSGWEGTLVLLDSPDGDAEIAKIFKPINDTITKRWPGKAGLFTTNTAYASFLDYFQANYDTETVGDNKYLISRLLPQEAFNDYQALGKAVTEGTLSAGFSTFFLVGGKGVMDAKPAGGSNSVNSHWRTAYVHTISATYATPFDKAATDAAVQKLNQQWAPIRDMTPTSGAYLNEASPFEPNVDYSFWGSNYERLSQIKKQVDPTDLLWCTPCVGDQGWRQLEGGQLCRV